MSCAAGSCLFSLKLLTLQAVTAFSLLADDVQNRVNQLSTLSVVTLGPVVAGTSLAEHKVVRAEDLQTSGSRRVRV